MHSIFAAVASIALASAGVADQADTLLSQDRDEDAFALVSRAADDGNPQAIAYLAWFYAEGVGVPADQHQAAKLYRKAAALGDAESQWRLGLMIDAEDGGAAQLGEAAELFRKAAAQGEARAYTSLGVMYSLGRGVPQDYSHALESYKAGARFGDSHAFNEIGIVHLSGEGVPKDGAEAAAWFMVAAMLGDPSGADNLAELFEQLDDNDVGRASSRADEIAAEYPAFDSDPVRKGG